MSAPAPSVPPQGDPLARVTAVFEDVAFVVVIVSAVALVAGLIVLALAL